MSESDFLASIPSYGDGPGDLPLPVAPEPDTCPDCGFPLKSFKHESFEAKGIRGHEPKKPAAPKPSAKK